MLVSVLDFINTRLEGILREEGYGAAVVKAVLAEQGHNPYAAAQAAAALNQAVQADDWTDILDAYARCVRITRALPESYLLRPDDFSLEAEKALWTAYQSAAAAKDGTVTALVTSLCQMVPAITRFFDNVLVMDEEPAVRENRLALLQHIADLPRGIADLSQLEGF
jgi:glycyl-tRNA synthetase